MSEVPKFPIERFQVERPEKSAADMPWLLLCMDDRYNLLHLIGWQLAGGIDGLGRDTAKAMELDQPHSFTKRGVPVHRMGAFIEKYVMRPNGGHGVMHHNCAAYLKAHPANQAMYKERYTILGLTVAMGLEISEDEITNVAEASERLINSGVILPTELCDDELLKGSQTRTERLPAIDRIRLVEGHHVAEDVIADWGDSSYWNAEASYKAGYPAYYIGFGVLRHVHRHIQKAFKENFDVDISERSLMVASGARHAAIINMLPRPSGNPLNVHNLHD